MSQTNLNFHLTFRPERQYISSLLGSIDSCNDVDIQEISAVTGIPTGKSSGKVEPTIRYAEYMGLLKQKKVDGKYTFEHTSLGQCAADEDPGLLEKLTLLIMHTMLVRPYFGAELWAHAFHNIFPKYRNVLTKKQFEKEIEIQFGPNVKLAPFYGTYQDIFSTLNVLSIDDDSIQVKPCKLNDDYVYLYAFVLFTYWNEWLQNAEHSETSMASPTEITSNHLAAIGFRHPFGWNEKEEYAALELIADKHLIALNRQMIPFTIRRNTQKETLVELLYSELC